MPPCCTPETIHFRLRKLRQESFVSKECRGHRESARGQFHDFDEFVGPFLKSLELFDVQSLIKIYHSLIQLCSDLGVSQHIL